MYDKEVINKHLTALLKDLKNLSKYKGLKESDFQNNLDLLWIIERGLYLSIQNIFDVLSHIVSAELEKNWESYSDIAEVLFTTGKISESQKTTLIKMAGFRNRLSHDYLGLEIKVLTDIVNNRIDDLYDMADFISKYS